MSIVDRIKGKMTTAGRSYKSKYPGRVSSNHGGSMSGYKYIMFHHTASTSYSGAINHMCNPKSDVSAHFVIGKEGECTEIVPMTLQAWHAGKGEYKGVPANKGNAYCIGIEVVNLGDGKDKFTTAQLKKIDEVIKYIDSFVGEKLPIIDHKAYAGNRKVDMRANFPLDNYKKYRSYKAPSSSSSSKPSTSTSNTSSSSKYTLTRILKVGSTGVAVEKLQKAIGVSVDGKFGAKTEAKVKVFQKSKGLTADGIVGEDTAKALGWSFKKKSSSKFTLTRLLVVGSRGDDVKKLQKAVGTSADGIFGEATERAVKVFQRKHGLTADGKVGKDTAKALGWLYKG